MIIKILAYAIIAGLEDGKTLRSNRMAESKWNAICENCESDMVEGPVVFNTSLEVKEQVYICETCGNETEEIIGE